VPARPDAEPLSKQLTIVVGLTVVGFMAFGLTLSFYRNILFEETLKQLEVRNRSLAQLNDAKYRELDYYRSTQYKDKQAKESLSLVRPGEKVLIIVPRASAAAAATGSTLLAEREAAFQEFLQQMPVSEQWWLYLFDRSRLRALKEGLPTP
jgi:cell division protein FtsB